MTPVSLAKRSLPVLFLCGAVLACSSPDVLLRPGTLSAIRWPPDDGCAAAPVRETLAVGTLLDRFGNEAGTFFSPKGEAYRARSMPYACAQLDYRVYRVVQPIEVQTCRAVPWFGKPGGAITNKTARPASSLVAEGSLSVVSFTRAGAAEHPSQCD
jgi:hypothetical protein